MKYPFAESSFSLIRSRLWPSFPFISLHVFQRFGIAVLRSSCSKSWWVAWYVLWKYDDIFQFSNWFKYLFKLQISIRRNNRSIGKGSLQFLPSVHAFICSMWLFSHRPHMHSGWTANKNSKRYVKASTSFLNEVAGIYCSIFECCYFE